MVYRVVNIFPLNIQDIDGKSLTAAREHLTADRVHLVALRCSLGLAAVRCLVAAVRLPGSRAFSIYDPEGV